jgi:hypothetical protein
LTGLKLYHPVLHGKSFPDRLHAEVFKVFRRRKSLAWSRESLPMEVSALT